MRVPLSTGKTLHESLFDPKQFHAMLRKKVSLESKASFAGQAPSLFVGSYGYPHIRMGLLTTPTYDLHDDPLAWVRQGTPLQDIVSKRSSLINAGGNAHVKLSSFGLTEKMKSLAQEAAMAVRPLDVDVALEKKPEFRLSTGHENLPHGPQAALQAARMVSNPKIPRFIDKVVDDTDLKATLGVQQLWKKGVSEHQLAKLFTAGTLGKSLERRLVPTRWGITAVDDTVGKQLRQSLYEYQEHDYTVFFGGYMGNYFLILCYPGPWSFELFENYVGKGNSELKTNFSDYEGVKGRSSYAQNTAGGYYATRLSVLEYLSGKKRQASVLALRFITDEYWAPLGVWVVREAVRAAFQSKPLQFGDASFMERYASMLLQRKFGVDVNVLLRASLLLKEKRSQTTLANFS